MIDLHGGDRRARLEDRERERPEPGAHLDDTVGGRHLRHMHDLRTVLASTTKF
jgi:hypothetical protein